MILKKINLLFIVIKIHLKEEISKKLILEKFQLLNVNSIFKEDEHYRII